jgi:hypothetical protein
MIERVKPENTERLYIGELNDLDNQFFISLFTLTGSIASII